MPSDDSAQRAVEAVTPHPTPLAMRMRVYASPPSMSNTVVVGQDTIGGWIAEVAALTAENARMKEYVARLDRWMQPKITLSIGLDYHDCEIVDVGHSEIQLMVRCPDLETENARIREELKDTLLEAVGDLWDTEREQYDTMASRTNKAMLDRLVEFGVLTRDPDGVGRRWFYRPAARPPAKGGE